MEGRNVGGYDGKLRDELLNEELVHALGSAGERRTAVGV